MQIGVITGASGVNSEVIRDPTEVTGVKYRIPMHRKSHHSSILKSLKVNPTCIKVVTT